MASSAPASRAPRFRPSALAAIVAFAIYEIIFYGLAASARIPYAEWFKTPANGFRTAVIPLAAGSVFLIAFAIYSRWDYLWRDPKRLKTTLTMKVALGAWALMVLVRLVGTRWVETPPLLVAAIVAAGVGVGFAEEMMFRGVFLRGMRAGGRNEAAAAIWTAIGFGLLHIPNLFLGLGVAGVVQVVIASFSGLLLYAWRRQWGLIWPAMVAHGMWDISTFATSFHGAPWVTAIALPSQGVFLILSVIVLIDLIRKDRKLVVIPAEG